MSEQITPQPENNSEPSRSFRMDEALTVVSGVNFLDIQNDPDPNAFTRRVGDLLSYATNEGQLETFQLPRVAEEVAPSILASHPELADLLQSKPKEPMNAGPEEEAAYDKAIAAWHKTVMEQYGDKMGDPVAISPISPEDHTHIDAGAEFQLMGGKTADLSDLPISSKPDIQPGAREVFDDHDELQDLLHRAIPDWEQVGREISRTSDDTPTQEAASANPAETHPSTEEKTAGDIGWAALKGGTSSTPGFDQKAYEQEISEHSSARDREQMRPAQQVDDEYNAEAAAREAARSVELDIPDAKQYEPYVPDPDPYRDVVKGAEYLTRQSVGDEAERYNAAHNAARWARHYENPDGEDRAAHPGQVALTYHMSKAVSDDERQRVMDTYTKDPSKLQLPPELQ